METSENDSALPWRWILEHLVDMKDIGTPILREILSYVPDLGLYNGLQKRVALRYLEEAIAGDRIDAQVVPLLECLLKDSQSASSYPTSADYRALLLRVKVEAVIVHIRTKPRDWHGFSEALDHYFAEDSNEAQHLEKRKELLTLLEAQGSEKKCVEVLETYSLTPLKGDLVRCVSFEKRRFKQTFLEKLLQDVCDGKCPLPAHKPAPDKKVSQEKLLSADGRRNSVSSDAQTVIGGRTSHANSEEAVETSHKDLASVKMQRDSAADGVHATRKRSSRQKPTHGSRPRERESCEPKQRSMSLRERDKHGKAVTSGGPKKDVRVSHEGISNDRALPNESIPCNLEEEGSLRVEFLEVGSDGHEELCHVCKEGGHLICCDGCPVAVHLRCLGSESSHVKEDWFCPWCVQRRAVEAVAKAREEELAATQRLKRFMANSNGKCSPAISQSRLEQRKAAIDNTRRSLEGSHVVGVEAGDDREQTLPLYTKKEASKPSSANGHRKPSLSPYSSRGTDAGRLDNSKGKRKEEPRRQEDNDNEMNHDQSIGHHMFDDDDGDVGATSRKRMNVASPSKAYERIGQDNIHAGDGDGHDGDLEEDYEGRKSNVVRPNKFRGNRIVPGLRRKRLLWSKEEEDTLKEGVLRFSRDNGGWGFQWIRILEFGKGKFDPSRTDVDLKDKWRNLAKRLN